jgi:hypothetical protein
VRRFLGSTLFLIAGISMAAPKGQPLEVMDVGSYKQVSSRPNPHQNKIVFIPSLAAQLVAAERKAGRPLSETEVKALRDQATVTVMPPEPTASARAFRSYDDINPDNVWNDWLKLRTRL